MRKSGILLHISSLPSKYGIGTFGKEAYSFVDLLNKAKQTYWQILPLGPTSYGDSPYQTFSAFALNPYFIDLDMLVSDNLIKKSDIIDSEITDNTVNYESLYNDRFKVLETAFNNFDLNDNEFLTFIMGNEFWLNDYALFMSLKTYFNDKSWIEWPANYRFKDSETINNSLIVLKDKVNFQKFIQFKAYQQWYQLKKYANNKGIKFIGDMPIYVAYDSADVWTNPDYFQLDENRIPVMVAGVPPDSFSDNGQLWGNPLYNWITLEKEDYSWWVNRIKINTNLFNLVRIDHFIGFENYFAIPFGEVTAVNGKWFKGPSKKLFDVVKVKLGNPNIIAEDLGVVTDDVKNLLKYTGFPGMKVLQFAFNSIEDSDYLPHKYNKNVVAYTATHDNDTTKSWFNKLTKESLINTLTYINYKNGSKTDAFIKTVLNSKANTAIIPLTDYLNLDNHARFNTPSTLGGNWVWRLNRNQLDTKIINNIKDFTILSNRAKNKSSLD